MYSTGYNKPPYGEKKEQILLSAMTKALTPTECSKKQSDNPKTPPKL